MVTLDQNIPFFCRERYIENMRRFVMKGSSFEPVRAQSATVRKHRQKIPTRPHTAFAKRESKTTISDTKEKGKNYYHSSLLFGHSSIRHRRER